MFKVCCVLDVFDVFNAFNVCLMYFLAQGFFAYDSKKQGVCVWCVVVVGRSRKRERDMH